MAGFVATKDHLNRIFNHPLVARQINEDTVFVEVKAGFFWEGEGKAGGCVSRNNSFHWVLIFPPFSNFRRCLIHQLVEHYFESLKSFSIGEGEERRTVVCFKEDFKFATSPTQTPLESPNQSPANTASDTRLVDSNKRVKRARTMPSVSIYRPPAARKLEQNSNLANIQPREMVRGSSPDKGAKELGSGGGKKTESNNGISVFRNAITSIRTQNKIPKCKITESTNKKSETLLPVNKTEDGVKSSRQRKPDIQVYVPKGRRSALLIDNNIVETSNNNNSINNNNSNFSTSHHDNTANNITNSVPNETERETKILVRDGREDKSELIPKELGSEKNKTEETSPIQDEKSVIEAEVLQVTPITSQNDCKLELLTSSQSCDESIASNTPVSGAVDTRTSLSETISEKDKNKEVHLNPDEDDWESMFDDSGECLDPSLLEQLTSAVGEVTIEKPKESYDDYKTKSLDVVGDEFPHVIEIYNFPPEFQLHDLMTVFSQFKNSGFEIKWVDDTHALGIFSSSAIVSEVLSFYHPFVKTRSLKEGTPLSKMKARRSAEFLQPYKPRPDTCPALARRLVTGALGVKLPTSREEREAEKKILTKAREKKRLEAKQKEDAWEGTFS